MWYVGRLPGATRVGNVLTTITVVVAMIGIAVAVVWFVSQHL